MNAISSCLRVLPVMAPSTRYDGDSPRHRSKIASCLVASKAGAFSTLRLPDSELIGSELPHIGLCGLRYTAAGNEQHPTPCGRPNFRNNSPPAEFCGCNDAVAR